MRAVNGDTGPGQVAEGPAHAGPGQVGERRQDLGRRRREISTAGRCGLGSWLTLAEDPVFWSRKTLVLFLAGSLPLLLSPVLQARPPGTRWWKGGGSVARGTRSGHPGPRCSSPASGPNRRWATPGA